VTFKSNIVGEGLADLFIGAEGANSTTQFHDFYTEAGLETSIIDTQASGVITLTKLILANGVVFELSPDSELRLGHVFSDISNPTIPVIDVSGNFSVMHSTPYLSLLFQFLFTHSSAFSTRQR